MMKNSLKLIKQQTPIRHKGDNPRSKGIVTLWGLQFALTTDSIHRTPKGQGSTCHGRSLILGSPKGQGNLGDQGRKVSDLLLEQAGTFIHRSIHSSRTYCTPSTVATWWGHSGTWDALGPFPRAMTEICSSPMSLCLDHLGWRWILPHVAPLGISFSTIISCFNNKDKIRARSMDVFLFCLQAGLTLY